VRFRATAYAPPATLAINAGGGQSAAVGTPVPVAPSVTARNAAGAPLAGVPVTFSVSVGAGIVRNPVQVTNANGVATVSSWTLGHTAGAQALTARSEALPPVVITATATGTTISPCEFSIVHVLGSTDAGTIVPDDCGAGATLVDLFRLQIGAQQNFALRLTGPGMPKYLAVVREDGGAISELANPTSDARVEELLFLGTGSYLIRAGSITSGATPATGNYALSSSLSPSFDGCWNSATMTRGVTISLALTVSDCAYTRVGSVGTYYNDAFDILLEAGATLRLHVASTQLDPFVEIRDARDVVLAFDDNGGGGTTAQLAFTAPSRGYYSVKVTSTTSVTTGAYTLTVDP